MLAALVLAMSDFLNPDDGPDPSGEFRVSPTFLLVLLAWMLTVAAREVPR